MRDERYRLAAPAIFLAVVCLSAMPIFHPNNTCHDWLEKWGQLHEYPLWLPSHQIASLGFAIACGVFLVLGWIGRVTKAGIIGASFLGVAFAMNSLLVLVHSTVVSSLGSAYNAAGDEASRQLYRTLAEAVVNYDVGLSAVAAVLLSGGAVAYSLHFRLTRWISTPMAIVLAGLGSIWVAQYYGVHRILHVPTNEWVPYVSLCLWMGTVGIVLLNPQANVSDARLGETESATVATS